MTFASKYDEAAFFTGPPAVFAPDPRGNLRVDPERTRELWLLVPEPQGRDEAVYVATDIATGVKMVIACNCPALIEALPRVTLARAADYASARTEAMEQWAVARPEALLGASNEA